MKHDQHVFHKGFKLHRNDNETLNFVYNESEDFNQTQRYELVYLKLIHI